MGVALLIEPQYRPYSSQDLINASRVDLLLFASSLGPMTALCRCYVAVGEFPFILLDDTTLAKKI